jgi:hypothetical protein
LQGLADVGFRFGSDGNDEARFERYRLPGWRRCEWTRNTERYRFNAGASNIGYRDSTPVTSTGKLSVTAWSTRSHELYLR